MATKKNLDARWVHLNFSVRLSDPTAREMFRDMLSKTAEWLKTLAKAMDKRADCGFGITEDQAMGDLVPRTDKLVP